MKKTDTEKPYQKLSFAGEDFTSVDGALEFMPTMHGYKLTVVSKEEKESLIAPQERTVITDRYYTSDGKLVATFVNATEWRVVRVGIDGR